MSGQRFDWLADGIPVVLRGGTLVAIGIVAIGYLAGLIGGAGDGGRPVIELIGAGGSLAVVGIGLLALTLLPIAVLVVTAIGFWRAGERGRMVTALGVLALLGASLVAATLLARAG